MKDFCVYTKHCKASWHILLPDTVVIPKQRYGKQKELNEEIKLTIYPAVSWWGEAEWPIFEFAHCCFSMVLLQKKTMQDLTVLLLSYMGVDFQ